MPKEKLSKRIKLDKSELPPAAAASRFPWENLPQELADKIGDFIPDTKSNLNAVLSSKLFQGFFTHALRKKAIEPLLDAIFMGNEPVAERIIRSNPRLLFAKGTYKMPLSNEDGTTSQNHEQIYHNVSPLELSFYTGDWNMWNKILPLIPEDMITKVLAVMAKLKRGGPDLVKMDRDPRTLTWEQLKYFDPGRDVYGNHCIYDLLSNPDGIICFKRGIENRYFYANTETQTLELLQPHIAEGDTEVFTAFQQFIDTEMVMNSSCRTSDKQHALIERIFKKTLERNGIHYKLLVHYHDTFDGSHRLINAYRKYIEMFYEPGRTWGVVNPAFIGVVGLAQRYAMPNIIQWLCAADVSFDLLPDAQHLKSKLLKRNSEFFLMLHGKWEINYPLYINYGLGFHFGLYKGLDPRHPSWAWGLSTSRGSSCGNNLAAICRIVETTKQSFNELEQELAKKLQHSAGKALVTI